MRVSEQYDLVVVGDQLSGFFLAAGAAQAGFRVLLLEGRTSQTALYEVPSGRFLNDLVCEPLLGWGKNSSVDNFLKSLGLYQEMEELFPPFLPGWQALIGKARLDFDGSLVRVQRELEREFFTTPNREKLSKLLAGELLGSKNFSDVIRQLELPVFWESFAPFPLLAFGSLQPRETTLQAYSKLMQQFKLGTHTILGGRSALKERLQARVKVFGGTIKKNTWVEEIIFEKGKFAGVLLSSYEGFIRSKAVIGSMGARTFYELLPPKQRGGSLERAILGIEPKAWRLGFTLLVPETSIPEGMAPHGTIHQGGNDFLEHDFVQWQIFPKDSYGGVPAGFVALHLRILLPFIEKSLESSYQARAMQRTLKVLESIVPFLREKSFWISPDPERLSEDKVFQKYYSFKSLRHIPPAYLVYEKGLSENLENTRFLDWSEFGLAGISLCSRDIHPYLGVRGEMQAAMELLQKLVHARDGKKKT